MARLVTGVALWASLAACTSGGSTAATQDRTRPDARTCDAFIASHGGHFRASGAVNVPEEWTTPSTRNAKMQATLRTLRSFNGGAQCTVVTTGSDLEPAEGCGDSLGVFLVAADGRRFVAWPCPHG